MYNNKINWSIPNEWGLEKQSEQSEALMGMILHLRPTQKPLGLFIMFFLRELTSLIEGVRERNYSFEASFLFNT